MKITFEEKQRETFSRHVGCSKNRELSVNTKDRKGEKRGERDGEKEGEGGRERERDR